MHTKYPQLSFGQDSHPIVKLFFEFSQLKNLYRQGWLESGVAEKNCESVADHVFMLALLCYAIAEEYRPDLDKTKVMTMALLHEVGEIYAGDITPSTQTSAEDKFNKERAGAEKVFSVLSKPEKYLNLWLEFEEQKTAEAIFVRQIDKLEMALQALLYEKLGTNGLQQFFDSVKNTITAPELKTILDDVIKSRPAK